MGRVFLWKGSYQASLVVLDWVPDQAGNDETSFWNGDWIPALQLRRGYDVQVAGMTEGEFVRSEQNLTNLSVALLLP